MTQEEIKQGTLWAAIGSRRTVTVDSEVSDPTGKTTITGTYSSPGGTQQYRLTLGSHDLIILRERLRSYGGTN